MQLMKLFDIQLHVCNFVYVVSVEYLFLVPPVKMSAFEGLHNEN